MQHDVAMPYMDGLGWVRRSLFQVVAMWTSLTLTAITDLT